MVAYTTVVGDSPSTTTSVTGPAKLDIAPLMTTGGNATTDGQVEATATPSLRTASSHGEQSSTTDYAVASSKPTLDPVVNVTGYTDTARLSTTASGPTARTAATAPATGVSTTTEYELISDKVTVEPVVNITGYSIEQYPSVVGASVIPTAYFRKVNGRALDQNGFPITEGLYITALDNFAVAGQVDQNGYFQIYLLKQKYEDFILLADAGQEGDTEQGEVDYVWYENVENPDVPVTTSYIELKFDKSRPVQEGVGKRKGLNTIADVMFG